MPVHLGRSNGGILADAQKYISVSELFRALGVYNLLQLFHLQAVIPQLGLIIFRRSRYYFEKEVENHSLKLKLQREKLKDQSAKDYGSLLDDNSKQVNPFAEDNVFTRGEQEELLIERQSATQSQISFTAEDQAIITKNGWR